MSLSDKSADTVMGLSDEPGEDSSHQEETQKQPKRQSPFRGFTQIVAGSGLGQMVTFFALPFLSRLYSPDQYGLLTLALAIVGLLGPVALAGMHSAVVVPRRDSDVAPLVASGLASLFLTAIVLGAVAYFGSSFFIDDEALRPFISIALPALLIVTGINLILDQMAVRTGKYGSIGRRNGILSISITVAQLALSGTAGLLWFNGLITGNIIGVFVGVLLLLPFAKLYVRRVSIVESFRALKDNWRFPLVFAPTATLTQLAQQAPILFIIYWYGTAAGGQVGMAERIVTVPLALLGLASSTVFIGELSHAVRRGDGGLTKIFLTTSKWLGLLGLVLMLALLVLATTLVPVFLGEEWETAARVAQVMAVVAATRIMTTPIRELFGLLKRARLITYAELIRIGLVVAAILVSVVFELPLLISLGIIYAALAASDIILWFFAFFAVREADRKTQN